MSISSPHDPERLRSGYAQLAAALGAAHHQARMGLGEPDRLVTVGQQVQYLWWSATQQRYAGHDPRSLDGVPVVVEPDHNAPAGLDVQSVLDYAAGLLCVPERSWQPLDRGRGSESALVRRAETPALAPGRQGDTPSAIVAVTVLLYLGAGLSFILALLCAAVGVLASSLATVPLVNLFTGRFMLGGFGGSVALILGTILNILLAIAIWRGRRWAWITTFTLAVLNVPLSFALSIPPLVVLNLLTALLLGTLLLLPRSRLHCLRRGEGPC